MMNFILAVRGVRGHLRDSLSDIINYAIKPFGRADSTLCTLLSKVSACCTGGVRAYTQNCWLTFCGLWPILRESRGNGWHMVYFRKNSPSGVRHFNASVLISNGIDVKTVQSCLGHSTPTTTLSVYAHAFQTTQAMAMKSVANTINFRKKAVGE